MSISNGIAQFIELTVSLDNGKLCFYYSNGNNPIEVTQKGTITYQLIDNTAKGLKFVGAAFDAPFAGLIDSATVSNDGKMLQFLDLDNASGTTSFRFIFSNTENTLLLASPDPQIINKDTK